MKVHSMFRMKHPGELLRRWWPVAIALAMMAASYPVMAAGDDGGQVETAQGIRSDSNSGSGGSDLLRRLAGAISPSDEGSIVNTAISWGFTGVLTAILIYGLFMAGLTDDMLARVANIPLAGMRGKILSKLLRREQPYDVDSYEEFLEATLAKGVSAESRKKISAPSRVSVTTVEQFMTRLDTCMVVAPLIGFFGTVWGLIASFHDIVGQYSGGGKPDEELVLIVADGLFVALVTTWLGLATRLAIQLASSFFKLEVRLSVAMGLCEASSYSYGEVTSQEVDRTPELVRSVQEDAEKHRREAGSALPGWLTNSDGSLPVTISGVEGKLPVNLDGQAVRIDNDTPISVSIDDSTIHKGLPVAIVDVDGQRIRLNPEERRRESGANANLGVETSSRKNAESQPPLPTADDSRDEEPVLTDPVVYVLVLPVGGADSAFGDRWPESVLRGVEESLAAQLRCERVKVRVVRESQ